MTTPGTTTTSADAGTAAVSPALGAAPATATGDGVAPTADEQAPVVDPAGPPPATVAVYRDEDDRLHYASPFSKATRDRVSAGVWTEVDPADVGAAEEPFDPTEHLVREVVAHLVQHADDQAEVARVKAAEAASEDRPTIRDWAPDDTE